MQKNTERQGESAPRIADPVRTAASSRIDVARLIRRMLLALIVPCVVAIAADAALGTWPVVTLITAAFAFPLAGFLVMRAALQEMQRVIEELAPDESAADDETAAHAVVADRSGEAEGQTLARQPASDAPRLAVEAAKAQE